MKKTIKHQANTLNSLAFLPKFGASLTLKPQTWRPNLIPGFGV